MVLGMSWGELLLLVLAGWTLVGVLGVTVSFRRGERGKAKRHAGWIVAVWLLYLTVLITVSLTAGRRQLSFGQDQCFGEICFAVVRAETMPGYLAQNGEQVVRVAVRITNRSAEKLRDARIYAYLIDAQGRRWQETPGLEGVRLTTTLGPRSSVISEPVFRVSGDAADLKLVFTRGRGLPHALVIGDSDSLFHPPVVVPLGVTNVNPGLKFR
jgi:hypothetical protein